MPRVLLLPLVAALLAVSGCGPDERPAVDLAGPPRAAATDDTPAATPRPHRTTPVTAPHSSGASAGTPTGGTAHRGKPAPLLPLERSVLDGHLLPVERMPRLGIGATWTVVEEGGEDGRPVGACQKTPLESIGAITALRRTYAVTDGARRITATQVVARFADDKSAWRAHEVLRSWRADCEERLDYPRKDVGPLAGVEVRVGTGDQYSSEYGPQAARQARTTGLGIVRVGDHLSVVEISTPLGAYPSERDPARVAVRRIARSFE